MCPADVLDYRINKLAPVSYICSLEQQFYGSCLGTFIRRSLLVSVRVMCPDHALKAEISDRLRNSVCSEEYLAAVDGIVFKEKRQSATRMLLKPPSLFI